MPLPPGDGYLEDEYDEPRPIELGIETPEPPTQEPHDDGQEYLPFDIVAARPTVFDQSEEPAKPVLADEDGAPLPAFDERWRDDFHGLAFIGSLSKQFSWLGHRFVIRTLMVDELLAVTVLTKEYQDTLGSGLAYRTAMAALAVQQVDGQDLPVPVGPEQDSFAWAFARFNYAKARWFQFTIDAIYNEYLELEEKTRKVVDALGKASGPTGSTTGLSSNSA